MSDLSAAIVHYIDRRLRTMDTCPGTWGSGESLELQALLLLELRTFLLRRRTYEKHPFEARDTHIKFVRRHFPGAPGSFISDQVPTERLDTELPKLLKELREELVTKLGPEDPFQHYKLVLELRFGVLDQGVSFASVSRYFLRFRRAIDKIIRPDASRRLQMFWIPEVRVFPDDGAGPRVQLLFDAPCVSRATRRRIFAALGQLLSTAAWSCGEGGGLPDQAGAEGRHIAENALRLFPGAGIASVRIGGTGVGRPPVELRADQAERLKDYLIALELERQILEASAELIGSQILSSMPYHPPRFTSEAAGASR